VHTWQPFFDVHKPLRYCTGCKACHSRRTLCFPAAEMSYKHLVTLQHLLDGTLTFTWTDDEHLMVFSLCNYFRLDETYILPMFKASLKLEYAFRYVEYRYFYFVYLLQEANFRALSTFLADWLALHFPLAGLYHQQLSIITLSNSYDFFFCHIIHRLSVVTSGGKIGSHQSPPCIPLPS